MESTPEVQSISTWIDENVATAITGTFDLVFAGLDTVTVPVSATSADMKGFLESLDGIDSVSVTTQSADYGATVGLKTWIVTFNEILGNVPVITASTANLGGTSATVVIEEVRRMGLSLGGTFVLNMMGDTTVNLPFDIEPDALKLELENLRPILEVDVKKEELYNGNRWTVSFTKNLGDLPLLEAYPYAYEIQEIETLGGAPTPLHGTFALTFNGERTQPISFDATDVTMKAVLEALSSIGRVDVTRTDELDAGNRFKWRVTFRSQLGNIDNLVPDTGDLSGSYADVSVTEVQAGDLNALTGNYPQLAVFKQHSGLLSYTGRYIPFEAGSDYSAAVLQLHSGGLRALYFDNFWLQDEPVISRVDPQLDFDWGTSAITNYGRDYISIRWFGKLAVPYTDTYVLYVQSSEGFRLWLDHELHVDTWDSGEGSDNSGTNENFRVQLAAGTYYDMKIEYWEETGSASFHLSWSSSYLSVEPIPSRYLFYGEHILGSPFPITVTPGAMDFPYTTAFGDGLTQATAGIPAQFVIQTKDQNGNNKTTDGDSFDVWIDGNADLAPFDEPLYIGQGQYLAKYLPAVSGQYSLYVQTVDGFDIYCGRGKLNKCSPFALTIQPGPTTPHRSQALGVAVTSYGVIDELVEAVAGLVSNFTIQARDTYDNKKWGAAVGLDAFETKMVLVADRTVQYRSSVLAADPATASQGLYQVQYSIPRADVYEIQTYLNGAPILMCPGSICQALGSPAILKVVHSDLHGSSCTVDDTATNALTAATSGHNTVFTVFTRDAFGNLRTGDRTTNSKTTGDGRSDAFLVEFAGQMETFRTSSAMQTLDLADNSVSGYFKLTFGWFRSQLCANCVTQLADTTLSVSSNLVGLLLPNTKFTVQECVFTAASVSASSITVVDKHGCANFAAKRWSLQVASSTDRVLTPLIPHDVTAAALKYILQDLMVSSEVAVTRADMPPVGGVGAGGYQWRITFLSHLAAWSEAHLAVEYPIESSTTLYATPLSVGYTASAGEYPVDYTPHFAGSYTVSVTAMDTDTHVTGSPFTVNVADDTTHGPSSLGAHGNWLVQGFDDSLIELDAGQELKFQVQLKDQRRFEQQAIRIRAVTLPTVAEVQQVLVTSASFQLSFRGSPTVSFAALDPYSTIRTNLEALYTIADGGIQVSAAPQNPTDTVARVNSAFLVTFTKDAGSLPLMVAAGATITRVMQGTTSFRKEIQTVTCTSPNPTTDGPFQVTFESGTVSVDANAALTGAAGGTSFFALLASLVGSQVTVYAEGTQTTVCAASSNRIFIQFDGRIGNVPDLVFSTAGGSPLTLASEHDSGGAVSGVYPAWGSFCLLFDDNQEATASIPFDASASTVEAAVEALVGVDQVSVSRDWFDVSTERSSADITTLAQWTLSFDTHSGNLPELVPDFAGIAMFDSGQQRPFVEVVEYARGSFGNNRSVTSTSDIAISLTTTLEDPGVQEVQILECWGSALFTLAYGGSSIVVEPYMSLNDVETKLNTIVASGVRVYQKHGHVPSSTAPYFPVCSVASVEPVEIVFEDPGDMPLISWSATANDVYLTKFVKGADKKVTPIVIANKETQQLLCQVTAQKATSATFDVQFGSDTITVGASTTKTNFETMLNGLESVQRAGGVIVSSTQTEVCLEYDGVNNPAPVLIVFQAIGNPPLLRVTERRYGIVQAEITETEKGVNAITYDGSARGLFNVSITPTVRSLYDFNVKVLNQDAFFPPYVQVHPTLASGPDSIHTAPAVVTQGELQEFFIYAIDEFQNQLQSSTEVGTAGFVPTLIGPGGAADVYPVNISESSPNTDGIFQLSFLPRQAGDYVLSINRRQAGGLWGTYFRNVDFTDRYTRRLDAVLDFQWKEASPVGDPFPNKYYSVLWEGEIRTNGSGSHVFIVHSDDAVAVEMDGKVLLDLFQNPSTLPKTGFVKTTSIDLVRGSFYSLRVKYRTRDAQSFLRLEWICGGVFGRSPVPSESLFAPYPVANTPFVIRAYPGVLDPTQVLNSIDGFDSSLASNATQSVVSTKALEPFVFELEAHDTFGNRRFHDGSNPFEVSLTGSDGWAMIGRVNDVISGSPVTINPTSLCPACCQSLDALTNTLVLTADIARHLMVGTPFRVINANAGSLVRRRDCFFVTQSTTPFSSGSASVVVQSGHGCEGFTGSSFAVSSVFPQDWRYLGTCSVTKASTALTSCSADFTSLPADDLLERGDRIVVGSETHYFHSTEGTFDTSSVPLQTAYLGSTSDFVPVFKAGSGTGRHTVAFVPYVKGAYTLSVKIPRVDAVHAISTVADSALGGSFKLGWGTETTATITFNAATSNVKAALEDLTALPSGGVEVASFCTNSDATQGCQWLVTFHFDIDGDNDVLTPTYAGSLTGNNAAVVVQQLTGYQAAKMVEGFPKTVNVHPGPTNPSVSTAYGRGLYAATAGENATFFVQMKDTHGNNKEDEEPRDRIQVTIFPSAASFTRASQLATVHQVSYVSEGLYSISYAPIKSGPHIVTITTETSPEVHLVSTSFGQSQARGGSFALRFHDQSTDPLAFDANATMVQQALMSLPVFADTSGNLSTVIQVSRTSNVAFGFDYRVTFSQIPPLLELKALEVINNLYVANGKGSISVSVLQPAEREHIKTSSSSGTPIVNEVQIVRVQAQALLTGGSFKLGFNGQVTSAIAFDATADTVQTRLESLLSIGAGGVSVSSPGTPDAFGSREWVVTFVGATYGTPQVEFWSSARYIPDRLVTNEFLIGDLPALNLAATALTGDLTARVVVFSSGQASIDGVATIDGISPFMTTVAHGRIAPEKCTAVDSDTAYWPGTISKVGQAGLHYGKFHSRSSFIIETRDKHSNLLDGTGNGVIGAPIREVQILELLISNGNANSRLSGTFMIGFAGQVTAALPYNAGIKVVEGELERLSSIGAVSVDTFDVQTEVTAGTVVATKTSNVLQTGVVDFRSSFQVNDWIRVGATDGPVFTVKEISAASITLSSPFFGSTDSAAKVYKQAVAGARFTFIVTFDSEMGDLPAVTIDSSSLSVVGGGTVSTKVTACDYLRTQAAQTTALTPISGSFSISYRGNQTPMLPWDVDAATMTIALEALDGIHSVQVSAPVAGLNGGFTWMVTLTSVESDGSDIDLLYAEGYMLLGKSARVAVRPACPFTVTSTGQTLTSQAGKTGYSFVPVLAGADTIVADVEYLSQGKYLASYDTPRSDKYTLDVRYAAPNGLLGRYFNNRWLYGAPELERVDRRIDFLWTDWITPTSKEHVSVRWEGYIKPAFTEDYTFSVVVNDGARLWIDNMLVIDQFDYDVNAVDGSPSVTFTANASVALVKERLSEVVLEYRENAGIASIKLLWQSLSQSNSVILSERLFQRSSPIVQSPFAVETYGVKPTAPTGAAVEIAGYDSLTIKFYAPLDDGGAAIDSYLVEWWTVGAYGDPEIQVVKVAKTNTAGTFTLSIDGTHATGPIAVGALYSEVEAALEALDDAGDVTVTYTSSATTHDYSITFASHVDTIANGMLVSPLPALTVDGSVLVGSGTYGVCTKGGVGATGNPGTAVTCSAAESRSGTTTIIDSSAAVSLDIVKGDPYVFTITGLSQLAAATAPPAPGAGDTDAPDFSIRVSAHNSAGYGVPSASVSLKPMAVPASPENVELHLVAGSSTSLRVVWVAPLTDNSAAITYFVVQWRRVANPSSNLAVRADEAWSSFRETPGFFLAEYPASVRFKYTIPGLTPGAAYKIAVSAENIMGAGLPMHSTPAVEVVRSKSPALVEGYGGVTLSAIAATTPNVCSDATSCSVGDSSSRLLLSWLEPPSDVGSPVTKYLLEWFEQPPEPLEVQVIKIAGQSNTDVVTGTFQMEYDGAMTAALPADVEELALQRNLEALSTLRQVHVERSAQLSGGYEWSVTFVSESPAIAGKSLVVHPENLVAAQITAGVGSALTPPIASETKTVTATAGSATMSSIGIESYAEVGMYVQITGTGPEAGLWKILTVATDSISVDADFVGASGTYTAQVGWTVPGSLPTYYHSEYYLVSDIATGSRGPYNYVITGLPPGVLYFARVSACNDLGCNIPTSATPASLAAPRQKPAEPQLVQLFTASESSLRVLWGHPTSDGGDVITHYRIEWDTSPNFDSGASGASQGFEMKAVANPGVSCVLTPCEAVIGTLERGKAHYVRVYAYNSFGYSLSAGMAMPPFGVPMTQPDPPVLVRVEPTGTTNLSVEFDVTHDDGGADVSRYMIEWDTMGIDAILDRAIVSSAAARALSNDVLFSRLTTQMLLLSADAYDARGSFRLSFMNAVTSSLPWDISADTLTTALEALETDGRVRTRRVSVGNGYAWFITFLTQRANTDGVIGKLPSLLVSVDETELYNAFAASKTTTPTTTLKGTNAAMDIVTVVQGMKGYEQQTVTVSTDAGELDGQFQLVYNQQKTDWLAFIATANDLKSALKSIYSAVGMPGVVGDIEVYKQDLPLETGARYTIVFVSRLGPNYPLVYCDGSALTSSDSGAVITCETQRAIAGALPAMRSPLYGSAVVTKSAITDSDGIVARYNITGLLPGVAYHVRVSAWNGVGDVYGETRYSTPAVQYVQTAPDPPRDVAVVPISSESLLATWSSPMNAGGSAITQYMIESSKQQGVTEQQVISISSQLSDLTREQFVLRLNGASTGAIAGNASDEQVRNALQGVLQQVYISTPAVAAQTYVGRKRVLYGGYGFEWTVTFSDSLGDVPLLAAARLTAVPGDDIGLVVSELVRGSVQSFATPSTRTRFNVSAAREVQEVLVYARSPVDLGGVVYLSFCGESTLGVPVDASAANIKVALEGLSTIKEVNVITEKVTDRTQLPAKRHGFRWLVTFAETYDIPSLLTSTDAQKALPFRSRSCGGSLTGTTPCAESHEVTRGGTPLKSELQVLANASYHVRIAAQNAYYESEFFEVARAVAPQIRTPMEAQNVLASPVDDGKVLVMWNPPLMDGGDAIAHYKIQWDVSTGFELQGIYSGSATFVPTATTATAPTPPQHSYTVSGLDSTRQYYFRVLAYNKRGYGTPALATPCDTNLRISRLVVKSATIATALANPQTLKLSFANYAAYPTASIPIDAGALAVPDTLRALPIVGILAVTRNDHSMGETLTPFDSSGVDTPQEFRLHWSITFLSRSVDGIEPSALGALVATLDSAGVIGAADVIVSEVDAGVQQYVPTPTFVIPGAVPSVGPSSVRVSIVDHESLGVSWRPPAVGSASKYMVEWSDIANFAKSSPRNGGTTYADASGFVEVVAASGVADAVMTYTIRALTTGTSYFVRVSAYNGNLVTSANKNLGYGSPMLAEIVDSVTLQVVSPGSEDPIKPTAQVAYLPTTVTMQVSAKNIPNQLDVKFTMPTVNALGFAADDGGAEITHFRVAWDTAADFSVNPQFYDVRMVDDVGTATTCTPSACAFPLGAEVQSLSISTRPLANPGSFRLSTGDSDFSNELCASCALVFSASSLYIGFTRAQVDLTATLGTNAQLVVDKAGAACLFTVAATATPTAGRLPIIPLTASDGCSLADGSYSVHIRPTTPCLSQSMPSSTLAEELLTIMGGAVLVSLDTTFGAKFRITFTGTSFADSPNVEQLLVMATDGSGGCTSVVGNVWTGTELDGGVLQQGVAYSVRVSALNSVGLGAPREATAICHDPPCANDQRLVPTGPPKAPRNVKVASNRAERTALNVKWQVPSSDGGSEVAKYFVEYSTTSFAPVAVCAGCVVALGATIMTLDTNIALTSS